MKRITVSDIKDYLNQFPNDQEVRLDRGDFINRLEKVDDLDDKVILENMMDVLRDE